MANTATKSLPPLGGRVRSLDRKWKEFLFAFSGFGPNFLMVLMGSYYSDALNPAALETGEQFQAILPGICLIMPALFPILYALGKVFDGIIDIPFAHITDTLSTKWGRRRPAIAVCFVPMLVSFVLSWVPLYRDNAHQLANTIWFVFWLVIFFATYTMCLIAFYGSLSTVCTDEPQRLRVSGYKSFFDTISYCIVYALVPVILSGLKIQIDTLVFACIPLMFTMIIPLFLIKEGEKYGYPENDGMIEEKISIGESLKLTFGNRIFRRWLYVNCCTFFGLQMFLASMNGLIIGGMGLNGLQMAILNTAAFGPVPVMLYLFNKVKAKKGVRFTYQSCLLAFAVSILAFFFASRFLLGEGNVIPKMIIGIVGSIFGSWSIGVFFMMPYLAPAQISEVEQKLTGKNHSAMYFAGNAVATSIVGAISGNLVYEYIKNVFITKDFSLGFKWATSSKDAFQAFFGATGSDAEVASSVFNFGNLIVPFIVCITCVAGFFLAFKLPRDFTPAILAKDMKESDPSLDISAIEAEEVKQEKSEIIFVQIGLSILSGFIFGFIWAGLLMRSLKEKVVGMKVLPRYLVSCLVPFASIYYTLKMREEIIAAAKERGADVSINKTLLIVFGIVLPILPLNIVSLAMLQGGMNKIYLAEEEVQA